MKIKLFVSTAFLLLVLAIAAMANREHDELSKVLASGRNSNDLISVIEKIETISKGTVIEVRYEKMDSLFSTDFAPYVFSVESITDRGVVEYLVNPLDFKVISKHKDFSPQVKSQKSLKGFSINLKGAVTKAQNIGGGKALNAEIEKEDSLLVYKIQLVQDNQVRFITVDPYSENVLAINDDKFHDR